MCYNTKEQYENREMFYVIRKVMSELKTNAKNVEHQWLNT